MRLSDVQHQQRAVSILRRALASGRTHHAYLFDGPEGVGKESAARALAARLLCIDESIAPDADACGKCESCRLLAGDNHPDLHIIHRGLHKLHPNSTIRASKGLFLVVDLIRHFLIEPASLKPAQSVRRLFIVLDAERMNDGAQNALLKTLEEPPGSAGLILVTSSAARLLPTIRSRCQCIPFGLLPVSFVAAELVARLGLAAADAEALARLSDGRLGVAVGWHRIGLTEMFDGVGRHIAGLSDADPEAFGKGLLDLATTLAGRSMAQDAAADPAGDDSAPPTSKTVPTDELRTAMKLVFLLIAALYRDVLVTHAGTPDLRIVPSQQSLVTRLAEQLALDDLDVRLNTITGAERMLDRNVAPQLVCEWLAVGLRGELPPGD